MTTASRERSPGAPRRAAISLLCLLLLSAIAGCSSKEEKFAKHLSRAEGYLAEGKDQEALVELRSALQVDPKSAETNWRLAEVLRRQDKAGDALFFYREAARLDPSRTDAMLAEASLLYGDDPARAEEIIKAVLEKEPGNAAAHLRMSELSLVRANLDEALAQAMTAIQLEPKKGVYLQQLGIVHRTRIREKNLAGEKVDDALFQNAIDAFQKADDTDGPYWPYHLEIARVYRAWPGHAAEAKAAYQKAVASAIASKEKNAGQVAITEARNYSVTIADPGFLRWTLETMITLTPAETLAWVDLARLEEQEGHAGEPVYQRMLDQNAGSVDAHVAYANWLVAKGRPDDAIDHLRDAADVKNIDVPLAIGALANLQFRIGRFEDAHKTIDKMKAAYPSHPRTELAIAQLAIAESRIADAAKLLHEESSLKENAEAQRMLAFCEMLLNNYPAATQAINHAVELSPEFNPSIVRLQAQIQHLSNDFNAAAQSYRKLVQNGVVLDPVEELRWVQSLYETGRGPAAKARLEAMLAKPDAPPDVALQYAFREADADPAKSIEVLEAALARNPGDPRLLDYLTNLDARAGRVPRALERLNKELTGGQANAAVLVLRGKLLASQKMWEAAEGDLRATFEAAPNYPGVSDLLVSVYQQQGKLDEAIASLEKADKTKALGGAQLYLLGRLYLQKPDEAKAQATYERVLKAQPDNAGAQNDLAYILAGSGQDLERALALAQAAQKQRPDDASVTDTLGFVYLKKGLTDPAIQQLRFAIELGAGHKADRPEFHHHLGLALGAAGRPDEAIAEFDKALALDPSFSAAADAKRDLEKTQAAKASAQNPS